jgi:hypothetical protein
MAKTNEAGKNDKELLKFVRNSDKKLVALVGLQALGVLASMMDAQEFAAFLTDFSASSDSIHAEHFAENRQLSQQDITDLLSGGHVKHAVREPDGVRVIGHDNKALGKIKTPLPFIYASSKKRGR